MTPTILVTGGAGFIGSHTTVLLQQAGYRAVILDNLGNSDPGVIERIAQISGQAPIFIQGDIRDSGLLARIFNDYAISAIMHFAGLKSVGESTVVPLEYYDVNVNGSLCLLKAAKNANVKTFVFSSSATVYGNPVALPITEDHPRSAANPYGHTKLVIEDILENLYLSDPGWRIARLRYFNPVGAHPSGLIGETPRGTPNNLMPYVAQVAAGLRPRLQVFGGDYETPDGTGVRDYIHIMDLAQGHIASLRHCETQSQTLLTLNLGTGAGFSVLDMVKAFEAASNRPIPYQITPRRPGDIAACWADTRLAEHTLGWTAKLGIRQMCEDAWRWEMHRANQATAK